MSGVLIHDGRRGGHRKWCVEAIRNSIADGAILTPFSTPRVSVPRNPSASDLADAVRDVGGEIIFDPMTHAVFLPNTNRRDFYDAWDLWGPSGVSLEDRTMQVSHVERVFYQQSSISAPHLAPTLQLNSPQSPDAYKVLDFARIAKGLDKSAWQSLVGTRSFWAAGAQLDAYIGSLAALRSPVWVITVANEIVLGQTPDLTDTAAFAGLCRTIHSLSMRSRVIVANSDYAGLPAVAAGADTVGSGWDRGQRTFDPLSFRASSDDSPRIPASYVTQGGLNAVLRRDAADAIVRWNATDAPRIRGDVMPPSDNVERMHHLRQLRSAVLQVHGAGSDRKKRVDVLRGRYATALNDFDLLIGALPLVKTSDKKSWVENPWNVLELYAQSEGF